MNYLSAIAMLLFCSSAAAQSIMTSGGGRSIVTSSHRTAAVSTTPVVEPAPKVPSEIEALRAEIEFLKSSLEDATSPPFVKASTPAEPAMRQERFLVSEPWCRNCPAAKQRFIASGGKPENIINIAQARNYGWNVTGVPFEFTINVNPVPSANVVPSRQMQRDPNLRYAIWGNMQYDMESWSRQCSLDNCPMCVYLDNAQAVYFDSAIPVQSQTPNPQSSSPNDVLTEAIVVYKQAGLCANDTLSELGCGDGLTSIAIAKATGCRVVGIEIDPVKVTAARRNVQAAGLSDRIEIIEGDVKTFRPEAHGSTAIYAYLYPELLEQIKPQLMHGRITVLPGHFVSGIGLKSSGQLWVRRT